MKESDLTGDQAAIYKDLRSDLTAKVADDSFPNIIKELNRRGRVGIVQKGTSGHSL